MGTSMPKIRLLSLVALFCLVGCTLPLSVDEQSAIPTITPAKVSVTNTPRAAASTITPAKVSVTSTRRASASTFKCTDPMTGGAYPKIPTISIADLYKCRPDARTMVKLIQSNGPFQYDHDDIVFNNREAILPGASKGT